MTRAGTISVLACAVAVCALAERAGAGQTDWQVGSGNWSSGPCWTAGEPGMDTTAVITNHGTATVTQMNENAAQVLLGVSAGQAGRLGVPSGALTVQKELLVGVSGTGTATQTGGDVTLVGASVLSWGEQRWFEDVRVGVNPGSRGEYDLSGGSLDAYRVHVGAPGWTVDEWLYTYGSESRGGAGVFTLRGSGTLTAGYLYVGGAAAPGWGRFEYEGGTLDVTGRIQIASNGTMVVSQDWIYEHKLSVAGELGMGTRYLVLQSATPGEAAGSLAGDGKIDAYSLDLGWYTGTSGTFTQDGGRFDVLSSVAIGTRAGAEGAYTLSDGRLDSEYVYVGYRGEGGFGQNGGTNATGLLDVAKYAGASGTCTVTGADSRVEATTVHVGRGGTGRFALQGGTVDLGTDLHVGTDAGAVGAFTQSGGSVDSPNETIGEYGSGRFTQTRGSNTAYQLRLGEHAGSSGRYELSGDGSLSARDEIIGGGGAGVMVQTGGTNTVTGDLTVSSTSPTVGSYELRGTGQLVSHTVHVGWGSFLQEGGTHTASGHMYVGAAGGQSAYVLDGGQLTVGGTVFIGNDSGTTSGSLFWSTGTLSAGGFRVGPGSRLSVRQGWIYGHQIVLNGGHLDMPAHYLAIQAPGTGALLEVNTGSLVDAYSLDLGWYDNQVGKCTQGGGTVALTTDLYVGSRALASGEYGMGGGSLNARDEYVGYRGSGQFYQGDGVNATGALHVGYLAGADGEYRLGGGTIHATGLYLGGGGGAGRFEHTTGSVDVTELTLGAGGGAECTYTISGGNLSADVTRVGAAGGTATFYVRGKAATISGEVLTFGSGDVTFVSDLAGWPGVSVIELTGTAAVDGTWQVLASNAPLGRYPVICADGGITGRFDDIQLPGPDWTWGIEGGKTLYLDHVPEPAVIVLVTLGAVALVRRRR